jgi:hypothetical protein
MLRKEDMHIALRKIDIPPREDKAECFRVIWMRNGGGRTMAEEMTHFETIINMELAPTSLSS